MIAILINRILAALILLLPLYFLYRPVGKINELSGYRTKKSMRSQAAWDFAQKYWPSILLKLSVGLVVFQALLCCAINPDYVILITAFLWLIVFAISILLVEEKLGRME